MKRIVVLFILAGLMFQASCATLPRGVDRFLRDEIFCREFNDNTTAAMEQARNISKYTDWETHILKNKSSDWVQTCTEFYFPTGVMETMGDRDPLDWKLFSFPRKIAPGDTAHVKVPAMTEVWVKYEPYGSGTNGPRVHYPAGTLPRIINVTPQNVPEYRPPLFGPYHPVATHVLFSNGTTAYGKVTIIPSPGFVRQGQAKVVESRDRVDVYDPVSMVKGKPITLFVEKQDMKPFDLKPGTYEIRFSLGKDRPYSVITVNYPGDGHGYVRGQQIQNVICFPESASKDYLPKHRIDTPYTPLTNR